MAKKSTRRRTMTYDEVKRLAFVNSKRLPPRIIHEGKIKEWVGIGWITLDGEKPRPTDVLVKG